MGRNEDTGSPGWSAASASMQTTEDVARAVASAAAVATAARSPRPSVIFSSKDDHGDSQFQKLHRQVTRALKGFASPRAEVKGGTYNPEVLTSQKRQWASFQLQYLDHKSFKEPSKLFESMVVVGLHPNCDVRALEKQYIGRKSEFSGRLQGLGCQSQSRTEPILEPQVLFVYPPEKQSPHKYKDLLSFCLPGGVEVRAVERTPSLSELNEILLSQEHLKQSDLSFVFRLQLATFGIDLHDAIFNFLYAQLGMVADNSTLYGCCVLVEEIVQKPSGLLSMISDKQSSYSSLSRHVLITRRCYCILSRLPFFELHFGVLNSIFTEERLERLMKDIGVLDLEYLEDHVEQEKLDDDVDSIPINERGLEEMLDGTLEVSQSSFRDAPSGGAADNTSHVEHQILEGHNHLLNKDINDNAVAPVDCDIEMLSSRREYGDENAEDRHVYGDDFANKQAGEKHLPNAVLPLLRFCQYESSESSSSFQGSPCEDRNFRSDVDDTETDEASFSGQEDSSDHIDILEWAKANNHGSLRILCEYYWLHCPTRGSTLRFHPLEHLHPLEYCRPDETVLHIAGSIVDLGSCSTSLEFAEAHSAFMAEEEALALSTWAVACVCGSLRLENVLALFAGALLEKQIVVVCSNLGILSAIVLSIVSLIRPYRWQSLLMPILPDDMLDFLDAPVPYIVGVKNKTNEVQSKLTNVVLIDANKNQVKSPNIPQLPKHRELYSCLSPYHAKLVGESYLARKRPVYESTDEQVEAAKGFLEVLRSYLDSLCHNLRSHTITNVQSNNDKVSLLLKESFIDSFPSRDRQFMKLFVDTQLFSVHTDLVLSFYQKE